MSRRQQGFLLPALGALMVIAIVVGLIALAMWGLPQYKIYSQEQRGAAALAEARQNRQILVEQANAEVEAARARAEAIELIGEAAQRFPEYRQQEFIGAFADALRDGKIHQIMYIPTEAGIPITEAGRR